MDSASKAGDLLSKLRSEVDIIHLLQVLEVFFVFYRPNQCTAVSILEKLLNHSTNSVFLLYSITITFLWLQSTLKVLLLRNGIAIAVMQPQTEVSYNP
jgi:hypothetical protein